MFSAEQYRALRDGAGLVSRRERGQVKLTGADRAAFLQGILTNDTAALGAGTGCYSAMLTANGRMVADMRVLELGDSTLLDVDASLSSVLSDRFDQMIFSEDAQVTDVTAAQRELGVYGPRSADVVAKAIGSSGLTEAGLEAMPVHANITVETPSGSVIVVRSDDVGVDGFDLFVQGSSADAIAARLREAGAVDVSAETAEITRIEAGRPRFLIDMNEDTIPLEAGIEDRAISLTKGCYVGQEIIIRVLHRGHGRVAKRLVGLSFDPAAAVPARGDVVRWAGKQLGVVTSATHSPSLGRPIALGYVHRDFAEPSSKVEVESRGVATEAVVTALPFVGRLTSSVR